METRHIRLTSAEIANLWNTYINDTMAVCVLKYFNSKVHDLQTKPIIDKALEISESHIKRLRSLYEQESHPIPEGFNDSDVDLKAPELFGDTFYLHYIKQMSRVALASYSVSLFLAARSDIRKIFSDFLQQAIELDHLSTELLLSKGLYIRAPYITLPSKVEYVHKQNFINQFLGDKRPLLGIEITHLYANIQTNALGKALVTAFSQTAQSAEIREFMVRGRDIAGKHMDVLGEFLNKSELKVPMTWDDTVTNSTVAPFSDKLMLYHIAAVTAVGIADYGTSISICMAKDISTAYGRLLGEVLLYAEDGANIMIKNGWMEQPPQADDRDALANV